MKSPSMEINSTKMIVPDRLITRTIEARINTD